MGAHGGQRSHARPRRARGRLSRRRRRAYRARACAAAHAVNAAGCTAVEGRSSPPAGRVKRHSRRFSAAQLAARTHAPHRPCSCGACAQRRRTERARACHVSKARHSAGPPGVVASRRAAVKGAVGERRQWCAAPHAAPWADARRPDLGTGLGRRRRTPPPRAANGSPAADASRRGAALHQVQQDERREAPKNGRRRPHWRQGLRAPVRARRASTRTRSAATAQWCSRHASLAAQRGELTLTLFSGEARLTRPRLRSWACAGRRRRCTSLAARTTSACRTR